MRRSAFDESRDQKIADQSDEIPRHLFCQANNCPNRWTVDCGQRLCSPHFHAEPHTWPAVTDHQQWREVERARRNGEPKPPETPKRIRTMEEKIAILRRLNDALKKAEQNPRAWVGKLQDRRANGETLSAMQRHALKKVENGPKSWGEE